MFKTKIFLFEPNYLSKTIITSTTICFEGDKLERDNWIDKLESERFDLYFFFDCDVKRRQLSVEVDGSREGGLEEVVLVVRLQLGVVPPHQLRLARRVVRTLKMDGTKLYDPLMLAFSKS